MPDFSPEALLFAGVRFFGIIAFSLFIWHGGRLGQHVESLVHGVSQGIITKVEKPQEIEEKFIDSGSGQVYTRTVVALRNIKLLLNKNFYFGLCLAIGAAFLLRPRGVPDIITRVATVCLLLLPVFVLVTVLHAYYVYDVRAASLDGRTYVRGVNETFLFTTLTFLAMPVLGGGLATLAGRWITPRYALMKARRQGKRRTK
jgi:hypothetical protein